MAAHRLIEHGFAEPAAPESAARPTPALGSLFHTPAFFRLHAAAHGGRASYFQWAKDERVVATIHFTAMDDDLWRSPARGTFAGYAWEPDLRQEDMFSFHDAVEARLAAQGARKIEVVPAPMAHDPVGFTNQLYLLRVRGYEMNTCDLNQSLEVSQAPMSQRVSYGSVKCLRKCEREGLVTEQLPAGALGEVYETLEANRAGKGLSMSMTLAQLQTMAELFPSAMALFGCRDAGRLAAAAVCLRISPSVLYVLYWGDRPGYSSLSPVVPVAEAIYRYAQSLGVTLLDAGISTVDRYVDFGLIRFKRGLGFTESLKVSMTKTL